METTKTYYIPEYNFDDLKKRIDRLTRRAVKLGCEPILFVVGKAEQFPLYYDNADEKLRVWNTVKLGPIDPAKIVGYDKYYPVTVTGSAPKLVGWVFVAVLQTIEMEAGGVEGLLRVAGDQKLPSALIAELRGKLGQCDHCMAKRFRNDVYVVRHVERDEYKVVGSTCIRDFLGHESPEATIAAAEYFIGLSDALSQGEADEDGYSERGPSVWGVIRVLEVTAAVIRNDGYLSVTKARETCREGQETAATVLHFLTAKRETEEYRLLRQRYQITTADQDTAEAAQEWARSLGARSDINDYQYAIYVLAGAAGIEFRNMGYAVSIIGSYQREMNMLAERKAAFGSSAHFGKEGERVRLTVELISTRTTDGYRGSVTTIMNYRTVEGTLADGTPIGPGNKVTWFAAGQLGDHLTNTGETYKVVATVAGHDQFQGVAQTKVNRVKLDEGQKLRAAKPKPPKRLSFDRLGVGIYPGDIVRVDTTPEIGRSRLESSKPIIFNAKVVGLDKYKYTGMLRVDSVDPEVEIKDFLCSPSELKRLTEAEQTHAKEVAA